MKLGELREHIVKVMELGTDQHGIRLPENAEVVVHGDGHWLRVENLTATFLRGRWTLLIGTVEPGAAMWATGCCAKDGVDCPSCMTGRCSECSECLDYEPRDDEDDARSDEEED